MIKEFLDTVFQGITDSERICLSSKTEEGFLNYHGGDRRYAIMKPGTSADYFCVSTIDPKYNTRKRENLQTAYCLVLDDIGTKSTAPDVTPSWVLESSANNYQWGYIIKPLKLTPENLAYYEGCVSAIAAAGLSDGGAGGSYRLMRVPGSLHKSGFVARVTEWNPERCWDLPDLMKAFDVEPQRVPVRRPEDRTGCVTDISYITDEAYRWLSDQGLVLSVDEAPWVNIVCPWHESHSNDDISAGFSPAWYGGRSRTFNCFHGHCQDQKIGDLILWIYQNGGPLINGPAPMPKIGVLND